MSDARTRTPSTTTGTDVLLSLLLALAAIGLGGGSLAWLFGNLANTAIGSGTWAPYGPTRVLFHPHQVWPHLPRPALLVCCYGLPAVVLAASTLAGVKLWLRHRPSRPGLADQRALGDLLPKKAAVKATGLRESLASTQPKDVTPDDRGVLLGTLKPGATEVRSSWEDVLLAIMAPRSGKTSGLAIPAILRAPGPVLLTSNKAANDAFTTTLDARSRVGTVWTLDPQQIAHAEQTMWWDILADAHDLAGARRLAQHFVTANVCKIQDLPDLYSHLGSRGVIPITILQSYRQGQRVWGETGMDALWSAATIKLIGSGIDDADFADKLSRLAGDHEVQTVSVSSSDTGKSSSVSMRTERVLPADAIRALPKGSALLLATGIRPALLDLKPWYREPDADRLGAASKKATAAITERALAKDRPGRDQYGPAA